MERFLKTLNRYFFPSLLIGYVALCLVLLAVTPEGTLGLLVAMLWAAVTATALRWGVWGILKSAQKKASPKEMKILLRTAEIFLLILFVAALVFAILLAPIPSVWLFFPIPLFVLQGIIKIDATFH